MRTIIIDRFDYVEAALSVCMAFLFILAFVGPSLGSSDLDNTIDTSRNDFQSGIHENTEAHWLGEQTDWLYRGGKVKLEAKSGPDAGSWEAMENAPGTLGEEGKWVEGAGDNIYVARHDSFWRWNPSSGWETLPSPQDDISVLKDNFKNGTSLAWDNGNHIYALTGASYSNTGRKWFLRYDISTGSWENLENTPLPQGPGGAMTWYENNSGEYLFAWIGTTSETDTAPPGASELWRFNLQTMTWDENLAHVDGYGSSGTTGSIPYGSDDGSNLVWTGGDYLYYTPGAYNEGLKGYQESHFLRYDIAEGKFEKLMPVPANGPPGSHNGIDDGGSLAWRGGDYLYAYKGGTTGEEAPPTTSIATT